MKPGHKVVKLSETEADYVTRCLPTSLQGSLMSAGSMRDGVRAIEVSRDMAEKFRSALTEELARVGFDSDYKLNDEGKMLEALIDRFFIA